MYRLSNYNKIQKYIDDIHVDKVYPRSIVEGIQDGDVFVDDIENPAMVLFWHYCGFAYIAGTCNDQFLHEIIEKMHDPGDGHSGRLALQTGNDDAFLQMLQIDKQIKRKEQYLFEYVGRELPALQLNDGYELKKIDISNYDILSGHIVPAFSWKSKEEFLNHGFGYCVMDENKVAACAFSAGISEKYVDIGVETFDGFKGKGYGKSVVSAMIAEILKRGQIPVWECNTTNEASMRLACSVGFKIKGIHPLYVL